MKMIFFLQILWFCRTSIRKMQRAIIFAALLVVSYAKTFYEYCVIGGGPAGLQMGYFLQTAGRDYVIFEKGN